MLMTFSSRAEIPDRDVCVVGAGPVGIALALACEELGLSVLLLESGREELDPFPAALTAGVDVLSFGGTKNGLLGAEADRPKRITYKKLVRG